MMLGARTAAWANAGGGWVNPYVTDGLIAMWDGEWNAGVGGEHDDTTTIWTDLISGAKFTPTIFDGGSVKFENGVAVYSKSVAISSGFSKQLSSNFTIEFGLDNSSAPYDFAARVFYRFAVEVSGGKSIGVFNAYVPKWSKKINGILCLRVDSTKDTQYIDGVQKHQMNKAGNYGGTPFTLGYAYARTPSPTSITGTIRLRGIRVYERALNVDEIAANYAVDKARFNLP